MFKGAILAAGEGSRFQAQGVTTPKALLEVGGVPLIVRVARALVGAGAEELHAIVHPRARAAEGLLGRALDGVPVKLRFAATPSSFHSLAELLPAFAGKPALVSMVDSVFDPADLGRLVAAAAARPEAIAGLAVTDFVDDETPLHVGLDGDHRIQAIGPAAVGSSLVSGGIYWLAPGIAAAARSAEERGVFRMRNFLASLLEDGHSLFGIRFGKIVDVDTPADLLSAEQMETQPL